MIRLAVRRDGRRSPLGRSAPGSLAVGLAAVIGAAVAEAHVDRFGGKTVILLVASIVAGASVVPIDEHASVSASFVVVLLAAVFLGPASACGCALIAELIAAAALRTARCAVACNMFGALAPALAASNLVRIGDGGPTTSVGSDLLVAAGGGVCVVLNFTIVAICQQLCRGERTLTGQLLQQYAPALVLSIALAVAGVALTVELGDAGLMFALLAVLTFSYMAHLLERARQRAKQHVALSWGVLAGLMHALEIRDRRAARHAAAVASFSRDIAAAVGLGEQARELAHTAGLFHDIGQFALSDRVAERGRPLTEADWLAIRRHPELGAEMLRDLRVCGPVAEVVLAHHERIDGRGYPRGLAGAEIPEIAKIVAVAEAYDTLTARDTYRTRMSSFEAVRELRRVAGTQLEPRYVEALAKLLGGHGVEYRHADRADFDAQLDVQRRIRDARG